MHKKRYRLLLFLLAVALLADAILLYTHSTKYRSKQLVKAIEAGDYQKAEQILQKDPDAVNCYPTIMPLVSRLFCDYIVQYPLAVACEADNVELVELLIEYGANINSTDDSLNDTPLLVSLTAPGKHRYQIAKILLDHGADCTIRRRNNGDYDALGACMEGMLRNHYELADEAMEIFREIFQIVNSPEYDFDGLLWESSILGNPYVTEYLLQNTDVSPDGHRAPYQVYIPLTAAVDHNHIEIVRLLLRYGATKDLKDGDGKTAMDYAVEYGYTEIIELLQS